MLTLEEAVANLDELLAPTWEAGLVSAEGSATQRLRTWTPTALAVRAAVCDVLMATIDETNLYCADLTKQKARIKCLLGDRPHG